MSPRVSVLIVSYNAVGHLEHCLEQLANRAASGAIEIVVVDNASTDGSADRVENRFPDVRLLRLPENVGFGAANNRAAAVARGDRLLLLNSDAWLEDGALTAMHAKLDADPRLGLVAPRLAYPDGRRQFAWAPETGVLGEALQMLRNPFEDRAWNHRLVPAVLRALTGPGWYSAACLLLRKRAFDAVGGFDPSIFLYFEDVDLCRRLRRAGWRLGEAPDARVVHVKGGSRDRGFDLAYRRGQLAYYRKHRPRWEQWVLRAKLRRGLDRLADPADREALARLLDGR